jgi:hypothetical protein
MLSMPQLNSLQITLLCLAGAILLFVGYRIGRFLGALASNKAI